MTDWDKEADEAADKTDAKLAAGVDKLLGLDLAAAFPDPVDQEKIAAAIKAIKTKTTKNERVACFKAVGVTLGASLFKAVQKAVLALAVALVVGAGLAQAQVKALDLSNPLADPRAGFAWDAQGTQLGVAFVPVIYWVGELSGLEYATLNWGMSDVLSNGKKAMLVSFGPRIDNVFTWLAGGAFAKRHLRFAMLPPVQVSLALSTADFRHYRPMLSVVTRFGGK